MNVCAPKTLVRRSQMLHTERLLEFMTVPKEYNVVQGLIGLGPDIMLELLTDMTSVRDVQNFLAVDKATLVLKDHERFSKATETALADRTGTRVVFIKRLPQLATVLNPHPTEEEKEDVRTLMFDIMTRKDENTSQEAQRIKKTTLSFKNLRIDNNTSFYAWALIYINGIGQLKKELCIFPEIDTEKKQQLSREWFKTIQLPPPELRFEDVKSAGAYSIAKTVEGQLWSRGMKDDGSWDDGEQWTLNSHFNAKDGLIPSSLGPSKIRTFCFELHRAVIILENGAVFAYGQLQEFQSWDNNIAADGFIELTDKAKLKPRFVDELRGSLPGGQGPFGIFGTFHVVKYFRRMNAFLTDQGIVIARTYNEVEKKNQYFYTPLDPVKWFGGEKIVHMNHHVWDSYVTESGKILVTRGVSRAAVDYAKELAGPVVRRNLPFSVQQLKTLILTKKTHVTAFRDDGRLYSISFEDESVQDVTGYANELVKTKPTDPNMIIKWFGHVSVSFYFLYE